MSWIDVLKLDAVTVGSNVLDTRPLPEEDKDCCSIYKPKMLDASAKYSKETTALWGEGDNKYWRKHKEHWMGKDCFDFYLMQASWTYKILYEGSAFERGDTVNINLAKILLPIIKEWEECEGWNPANHFMVWE
jgi:hypothetical protein